MKKTLSPSLALAITTLAMNPQSPAHIRSTFHFNLAASLQRAAPLFGPQGERCWAGPNWNPQFLYPQPPQDSEGAIFTVQHGEHKSIWVNTVFDLSAGRMQYVSIIPDIMVSVIAVRLTALNPTSTGVDVSYTRTALTIAANDTVRNLAAKDQTNGPDWKQAIQTCLTPNNP